MCRSGVCSTNKSRYIAMATSQNGDGECLFMLWTDVMVVSLALNVACCWPRHCTSQPCTSSGSAI